MNTPHKKQYAYLTLIALGCNPKLANAMIRDARKQHNYCNTPNLVGACIWGNTRYTSEWRKYSVKQINQ